tara:strand:+ start:9288 stop:9464 length:177 start_codon:yes stop_codon:yes gene_type:complete
MNVNEINKTIDEITSVLKHIKDVSPVTKTAVPLLLHKLKKVKEYIDDSYNRELFGKEY